MTIFRAMAFLTAVASAPLAASPSEAAESVTRSYATVDPLDQSVMRRILPQTDALVDQLLRERRGLTIDGVEVFKQDDKFLPGKIAAIMAYRITSLNPNDPRLPQRLKEFSELADLTLKDTNETWGVYYYISALDTLRQAGVLDRAVKLATLAKLREQLDWRRFVRPDYTLINLPNNYYGVAFAVAGIRHRMGWEDRSGADALLTRTLDHYRKYSGEYGFADETDGQGRFDRYSVLLIAEIAQRIAETDTPVPPEVREWLKASAKLVLLRMNLRGEGWEYGRSIGAYGDTAMLEVLAVAARLKVLTPEEEQMAYAFSSRIAVRYIDFWVDPQTGSVNLWDKGRRTDAYRGKHRIFGENLSLARQFLYTNAIWNDLGYHGQVPNPDFEGKLGSLPKYTLTWFSRGEYDRALVTLRDRGMMISLPIISGAEGLHRTNPYFPIPFSPGVLQGTAEATYPRLLPRIRLADGTALMPLVFFKDVRVRRSGTTTIVSWRQDGWDNVDGTTPQSDPRLSVRTRYVFSPGKITREDDIQGDAELGGAELAMEFAGFSDDAKTVSNGKVRFGKGAVTAFSAQGYGACTTRSAEGGYSATTGTMETVVGCSRTIPGKTTKLKTRWEILYDPRKRLW